MAILIRGKSVCRICGNTLLLEDPIVSFPAFLPVSHPLYPYSDANFHQSCIAIWEERSEFNHVYSIFEAVMAERPKDLRDSKEIKKWISNAHEKFLRQIAE